LAAALVAAALFAAGALPAGVPQAANSPAAASVNVTKTSRFIIFSCFSNRNPDKDDRGEYKLKPINVFVA
jgi:hypothetical protein